MTDMSMATPTKKRKRKSMRVHRGACLVRWAWMSCVAGVLALGAGSVLAATTVRTTISFDYEAATGRLKKSIVEPENPNLCVVTEYLQPDGHGRPKLVTTRNCAATPATVAGAPNEAAAPSGIAAFPARDVGLAYSSDARFVETTRNPMNHEQLTTYDGRFGVLASQRDANLVKTQWTYDGLGRKIGEIRPDKTQTKWEYVYCTYPGDLAWQSDVSVPAGALTSSCDTVAANFRSGAFAVGPSAVRPVFFVRATPLDSNNVVIGAVSRTFYDAHGREIRSETEGFDGSGSSQPVFVDTSYGLDDEVAVKTLPGAVESTTIAYTYDALGRVTRQLEPKAAGGSAETVTNYAGLLTTVTDPKGFSTSYRRNVAGQVDAITDAKGGLLQRAYDPMGNLARTTDAAGNVISIVYDSRSRKTALFDPDLGVVGYCYDALGQLKAQQDQKLRGTAELAACPAVADLGTTATGTPGWVTMAYDKLGRQTARNEPDLTSNWYYDQRTYTDGSAACEHGIGKLCEATGGNDYRRRHFYDESGRPSAVVTFANNKLFTASTAYDLQTGRVSSQTYPTGLQIKHIYTPRGYPWRVDDARTNAVLWTMVRQDPKGMPLEYRYGNGVVTTNTYFPDGMLKTTQAGSGATVQNLVYGYDLNRNIDVRMDVSTGITATYLHDELNRLRSETRSGGALSATQVIGWDYNAIGNMTARTEAGVSNTYLYNTSGLGSQRPHAVAGVSGAVNGISAPRYSYDVNGNLTSGAGRTVAWTSFNMVRSVNSGGAEVNFVYDTEHERVVERYVRNGGLQRTTVYLNPAAGAGLFYEEESGVAGTKKKHYVSAGGSTIAMIVCTTDPCTSTANTATQYWHQDHQGTVLAVSNAAGLVERLAYEPFGKRRNSNGATDPYGQLVPVSTDRGYTGHEHMDEVGLINMNGRLYDPALARFMSADPKITYPDDTGSYNRYSYVLNNPLGLTDPSGFDPLSLDSPTYSNPLWAYSSWNTSSNFNLSGSLTGYGGYSILSGNVDGFSTGSFWTDPMVSFSGGYSKQSNQSLSIGGLLGGEGLKAAKGEGPSKYDKFSTWGHVGLAGLGAVPFLGVIPDAIDFVWTAAEMPFGKSSGLDLTLAGGGLLATAAPVAGDGAAAGLKIAARLERAAMEGHHGLAKFLGGNEKQVLSRIDSKAHTELHSLLRQNLKEAGIPLNVGGKGGSAADWARYMNANPGAQRQAFDAVLGASRAVDARHGTSITQDVWRNIMNGNFTSFP